MNFSNCKLLYTLVKFELQNKVSFIFQPSKVQNILYNIIIQIFILIY
jgi:hypothetical protein